MAFAKAPFPDLRISLASCMIFTVAETTESLGVFTQLFLSQATDPIHMGAGHLAQFLTQLYLESTYPTILFCG